MHLISFSTSLPSSSCFYHSFFNRHFGFIALAFSSGLEHTKYSFQCYSLYILPFFSHGIQHSFLHFTRRRCVGARRVVWQLLSLSLSLSPSHFRYILVVSEEGMQGGCILRNLMIRNFKACFVVVVARVIMREPRRTYQIGSRFFPHELDRISTLNDRRLLFHGCITTLR
jgi:hypothetical protein